MLRKIFALRLEDRPDILGFIDDDTREILGWGRKPSGAKAQGHSQKSGVPYLLLEDGFLRSIGREDRPSSLVLDRLGIYYDATTTSDFEEYARAELTAEQHQRAMLLIDKWREARVSKYNSERDYQGVLPERYVLVCDQTLGDHSIRYGLADENSFRDMLAAAMRENPDCTVVVKTHPDRFTRRRKGYFTSELARSDDRVVVISEPCHPVRLIENAERVYCVTSQMGFEALIWGRPVRTFGMPFYAGWGLTTDQLSAPNRRCRASLAQIVHAALVDYPRYVDPETGVRCEVERVLDYFGHQRRVRERFAQDVYAIRIPSWKRPLLRQFMAGSVVHFRHSLRRVPAGAQVVVWGSRAASERPTSVETIRVEDGFLRSVGLGADLVRPMSWVLDDLGIYYDASRPSRLENLLSVTNFDQALCDRAAELRRAIVEKRLTKYNTGWHESPTAWKRPASATRVVLVPGQVEDDASIRLGTVDIRSNLELLKATRRQNLDAYIIYKPHPDVVAGLRKAGGKEGHASEYCNEVVTDIDMASLLDMVDEVHTMTSLTGFEALLRGIPVTCYGLPFYAGWGLTNDMVSCDRRTRELMLDELIAGSLILYPTYISHTTDRHTTPERIIDELSIWKNDNTKSSARLRYALRLYEVYRIAKRKFFTFSKSLLNGAR